MDYLININDLQGVGATKDITLAALVTFYSSA